MDPIANMFIQLKNSAKVVKKDAKVKYSKLNISILEILKNKGYISDFSIEKKENQKYPSSIIVTLKFKNQKDPVFSDIKRISRPGRRIYVNSVRISKMRHQNSEVVISTSKGVMSGTDARKKGLGGELICEVI